MLLFELKTDIEGSESCVVLERLSTGASVQYAIIIASREKEFPLDVIMELYDTQNEAYRRIERELIRLNAVWPGLMNWISQLCANAGNRRVIDDLDRDMDYAELEMEAEFARAFPAYVSEAIAV